MTQYLFSYGTLQMERVQIELFNRLLLGARDRLQGYRLGTLDITDASVLQTSQQAEHPIAIPSEARKDFIPGMVYKMTEEEMILADSYEVDDYKRIEVQLSSRLKAWVYVLANIKNDLP